MKSKKLITGLLAIGLLAGAFGGAYYLTDGFTTIDLIQRFKEKQTCIFEIDNEVNFESGSTVSLPKNIIIKQTLEESFIETKASINILAGVSSTKKLTWRAVFVDGTEKVSDYINIEPSNDTFSAKLTINQAFSNQIKITISSSNGLSNDIYLDYAKRFDSISNNIITGSEAYNIEEVKSSNELIDSLNKLKNGIKINIVGSIGNVESNIILNKVGTKSEFNIDELLNIDDNIDFSNFFKNYNSTPLSDYLIKYMCINSSVGLTNYNSYISQRLNQCYYENIHEYWNENIGYIYFDYNIEIINDDGSIKNENALLQFKNGNVKVSELHFSMDDIKF